MPIDVTVFSEQALVYVRFTGVLSVPEQNESFDGYTERPDFAPGFKYLLDLRPVTGFDGDQAGYMEFLSKMATSIPAVETSILIVYLADNEISQNIAQSASRSLSATNGMVVCITETERQAMDILGLPHASIADLELV